MTLRTSGLLFPFRTTRLCIGKKRGGGWGETSSRLKCSVVSRVAKPNLVFIIKIMSHPISLPMSI